MKFLTKRTLSSSVRLFQQQQQQQQVFRPSSAYRSFQDDSGEVDTSSFVASPGSGAEGMAKNFRQSANSSNSNKFQNQEKSTIGSSTSQSVPFPEEKGQEFNSLELYPGASSAPFSSEVISILHSKLDPEQVEIRPDGATYLSESHYRRLLTSAFGSGGWCLLPRSPHSMSGNILSREYALFCQGRFVSQARGHATIQGYSNPAIATEIVRSIALSRTCKDLGIGQELSDSNWVNAWRENYATKKTDNYGKIRWSKKNQYE
jgi:hypothetical protein